MRKNRPSQKLAVTIVLLGLTACGVLDSDTGLAINSSSHRQRDVENKMSLALGGVPKDWDEVKVPDDEREDGTIDFETQTVDFLDFEPLNGSPSFDAAGGGKVIPLNSGVGTFYYRIVGVHFGPLTQVTVPPQALIQILVGEAYGQLNDEVTLNNSGSVALTSVSLTGEAIGAVIRNRVNIINDREAPNLFVVDASDFEREPYQAVIEAGRNGFYQFSPVDPNDLNYEKYTEASDREGLDEDLQIIYDQAVLTAADIFNGDAPDPTGGAFAFFSPTPSQYEALQEALASGATNLPSGVGTTDAQFPAFAPIQVLVLDEIDTVVKEGDTVPSFVFIRERDLDAPAVTNTP